MIKSHLAETIKASQHVLIHNRAQTFLKQSRKADCRIKKRIAFTIVRELIDAVNINCVKIRLLNEY